MSRKLHRPLDFTLNPYIGAEPITFGMSARQVVNTLGPPESVQVNYLGERDEQRNAVGVRYAVSEDRVVEIGIVPGANIWFNGRSLFEEPNLVKFLRSFDRTPYEMVGFLIFMELGIAVTGFHDSDDSQKAITMFCRGRWDEMRPQFKKYRHRRG